MELFFRNIKTLTELFNGMKPCKVPAQNSEYEEQTVAGIRDNDIRKDGMGMLAAITEHTHDADTFFQLFTVLEVGDGSAVVIVDMAVSGAATDGTCFQPELKLLHVGVEKRF